MGSLRELEDSALIAKGQRLRARRKSGDRTLLQEVEAEVERRLVKRQNFWWHIANFWLEEWKKVCDLTPKELAEYDALMERNRNTNLRD
jgi:hypothetical protein